MGAGLRKQFQHRSGISLKATEVTAKAAEVTVKAGAKTSQYVQTDQCGKTMATSVSMQENYQQICEQTLVFFSQSERVAHT